MYVSSIASDAQSWEFFTNHLQSTDSADFHHGGRNQGKGWVNQIQYTLTFIKSIELKEFMPNITY